LYFQESTSDFSFELLFFFLVQSNKAVQMLCSSLNNNCDKSKYIFMHQQLTDIEKETMDMNIDRTGGGI